MKLKLAQSADLHPSVISEQDDEINKRRITHSLKQTFRRVLTGRPEYLTPEQIRLIEQATPQERQAYVKRQSKMTLATLFCLGVAIAWVALQPKPLKPEPVVQITDAGSVKEIQLHETSLSTATTVTTTAGVYQVRGGVSGAAGDEARVEAKEVGTLGVQKSLCIKSSIKTACYTLM